MIHFLHSNRIETLALQLAQNLADQWPQDPLANEVVLVPHAEMGRWLQKVFAQQWGVAMSIKFPLPARFLWELMHDMQLQSIQPSAYETTGLAWRIYRALSVPGVTEKLNITALFPEKQYVLQWQFASQIALLFDAYLVYRPDWIIAWEKQSLVLQHMGLAVAQAERWQSYLWNICVTERYVMHRASLMQQFNDFLQSKQAVVQLQELNLPKRMSVFAVMQLPPVLLQCLMSLSQYVEIHWYFCNPSAEYWADIVPERQILRKQKIWQRMKDNVTEGTLHYETAHPLLADWGRVAQDFLQLREKYGFFEDDEVFVSMEPSHLLAWLQKGMFVLDPGHAPLPARLVSTVRYSVQVHACHHAYREVEVMQETLWALFAQYPDLQADQILITAPRLDVYIPLIQAVFETTIAARKIPYVLPRNNFNDGQASQVFLQLLQLPVKRLTLTECFTWLEEPLIAQRFGLSEEAVQWLRTRFESLPVRWGYDAKFREDLGVGAYAHASWQEGFDRLFMGYALGADDIIENELFCDADVEGEFAVWVGLCAVYVKALYHWYVRLQKTRYAKDWHAAMLALLETFFMSDDISELKNKEMITLREQIQVWYQHHAIAQTVDELLPVDVVHLSLSKQIQDEHDWQASSVVGVRVSQMTDVRGLPFRVIYILGLDENSYPRETYYDYWDLMRHQPRLGDRSVRHDDRYLFLELLLAARDELHLSYICYGKRDGEEQAPSQLITELMHFVQTAAVDDISEEIIHKHSPLAYDPQLFAVDAPQTFASEWVAAAESRNKTEVININPIAFDVVNNNASLGSECAAINMNRFLEFCRDPMRFMAMQVMSFKPLWQTQIQDEENLVMARYGDAEIKRFIIREGVWHKQRPEPLRQLLQAQGLLPLGETGAIDYEKYWEGFQLLRDLIVSITSVVPPACSIVLPENLWQGGVHLQAPGVTILPKDIHGGDMLHCAMMLSLWAQMSGISQTWHIIAWGGEVPKHYILQSEQLSSGWLSSMRQIYLQVLQCPLPLFRKASWIYASLLVNKEKSQALQMANDIWSDHTLSKKSFAECNNQYVRLMIPYLKGPVLGSQFMALAEEIYLPIASQCVLSKMDG